MSNLFVCESGTLTKGENRVEILAVLEPSPSHETIALRMDSFVGEPELDRTSKQRQRMLRSSSHRPLACRCLPSSKRATLHGIDNSLLIFDLACPHCCVSSSGVDPLLVELFRVTIWLVGVMFHWQIETCPRRSSSKRGKWKQNR